MTVSKKVTLMVLDMGILGVLAMVALEISIVVRDIVSMPGGTTITFSVRGPISHVIRRMSEGTELCNLAIILQQGQMEFVGRGDRSRPPPANCSGCGSSSYSNVQTSCGGDCTGFYSSQCHDSDESYCGAICYSTSREWCGRRWYRSGKEEEDGELFPLQATGTLY
jgi:hypothetical protein